MQLDKSCSSMVENRRKLYLKVKIQWLNQTVSDNDLPNISALLL